MTGIENSRMIIQPLSEYIYKFFIYTGSFYAKKTAISFLEIAVFFTLLLVPLIIFLSPVFLSLRNPHTIRRPQRGWGAMPPAPRPLLFRKAQYQHPKRAAYWPFFYPVFTVKAGLSVKENAKFVIRECFSKSGVNSPIDGK